MALFAVRVWVPDRPGALGLVASRIGAVRGDLVGIDILERGGGRAIDELVVDLPDESLVGLLLSEMSEVDGVDVEDVRPAPGGVVDPRLDALETAASLLTRTSVGPLLEHLARSSLRDFGSDWAAIVQPAGPDRLPDHVVADHVVAVGAAPAAPWIGAFLAGSRASVGPHGRDTGPDDIAWADLDAAGLVLVLGRDGRPFRARERRQLAVLTRIADRRWAELVARPSRRMHPSRAG